MAWLAQMGPYPGAAYGCTGRAVLVDGSLAGGIDLSAGWDGINDYVMGGAPPLVALTTPHWAPR